MYSAIPPLLHWGGVNPKLYPGFWIKLSGALFSFSGHSLIPIMSNPMSYSDLRVLYVNAKWRMKEMKENERTSYFLLYFSLAV